VIEKRVGIGMADYDAYVNVVGGMKVTEPALDLAVVMAIFSSYRDISVPADTIVFGEVGLSGEIRSVSQVEQRVKEAIKLGFKTCILPKSSLDLIEERDRISLIGVASVRDCYAMFRNQS